MSIVFINNSQETFTPTCSGAIATWIWEVSRIAQSEGRVPYVVSRECDAPAYPLSNLTLIPYRTEPSGGPRRFVGRLERKVFGYTALGLRRYAKRVIEVIRAQKLYQFPLVLHNDLELAVLLRRHFPGTRILHHFHNQIDCKARFHHELTRSCSAITAVSDFTARWVEKQWGLSPGSIGTVYNGVDARHFRPGDGGTDGTPVVNFVGRTGIEKAPDLLLEAARILAIQGVNFSLQVIGSNYWEKFEVDCYQLHLQSLITDLERRGIAVRKLGHVPRASLPNELRRAQIHVVPSRWEEPFGLVTLEGMACGLATIASRTGGSPEVIGDSGLLFDRDDAQGLADQLRYLIANARVRAEYAARARSRALEFSWSATYAALMNYVEAPPNRDRRTRSAAAVIGGESSPNLA